MSEDYGPPIFALFKEIGIIEQLSRTRLERVLPDGMTASQFGLLNHLARLGGNWSPVRLAAAFQVTKGAMTNTVGKLLAHGWVNVIPDPKDQRGKLVSITKAGLDKRNECIDRLGPALADVATVIDQDDLDKILPVLERLRDYLDNNRE